MYVFFDAVLYCSYYVHVTVIATRTTEVAFQPQHHGARPLLAALSVSVIEASVQKEENRMNLFAATSPV